MSSYRRMGSDDHDLIGRKELILKTLFAKIMLCIECKQDDITEMGKMNGVRDIRPLSA